MLLPAPPHAEARHHSGGQCGEVRVVLSRPDGFHSPRLENDELYTRERVPSIVQVSPWESDTHRLLDFRRKIGVFASGKLEKGGSDSNTETFRRGPAG